MAPFGDDMAKTPLALVKERFVDKEKLAAAVEKLATKDLWLDRVNADRGFIMMSNAKLLRIHDALEDAKKRFGSRAKLIAAVVTAEERKDAGYSARLEKYPLPRLLDMLAAAEKRAKAASKKTATAKPAAAKPAAAKPAAAKAVAKKAPAKK
jgi:hypothetical protein